MKQYKRLSKLEKKNIITKHFQKRISQAQLAKEYDTNRTTISVLCRKNGNSPLMKYYKLDDKKILDMYFKEKTTITEIANKLGITRRPIYLRIKLSGNKLRDGHTHKRAFFFKNIPNCSYKLKIWAAKVWERDDLICLWCKNSGTKENYLEAHHIIPIRMMEDETLLFDLNNGITLCQKCHLKVRWKEEKFEKFFKSLLKTN